MRRFKKSWKKILSLGLVIIIGISAIGGIAGFAARDTKTISSTAFSRGALDENGMYVKTKQSIYTEKAFECIGLCIEQDFESHATYDVYYYDYDGKFLESRKGLTGTYSEDYAFAKLARIVIHPTIPEDETENDFSIKFYEVYGIANDFTIKVNKNQEYLYEDSINLYNEDKASTDKSCRDTATGDWSTNTLYDVNGAKTTEKIEVFDENGKAVYEKYDVYVKFSIPAKTDLHVCLGDSDGTVVKRFDKALREINDEGWVKFTFEIPGDVEFEHLRITMPSDADCYIFGYN